MTLLLLAGTGEARMIAQALQGRDVIASLAGVTRDPEPLAVPVRQGGFGGEAGFRDFLAREHIHAVLDATHPYAARITARSAAVCAELGLPFCQVLRPAWVAEDGDLWTEIATEADAAAHIPMGATVFLGTGRQSLPGFANLAGRRVICRQIDPPEGPFPFAGGEYLVGRPPFSVADETALFHRLGVDWLVVKNAGGQASATKLTAARDLGIPVLMLARPALGDWPKVESVAAALDWVAKCG
ncbi:MULTISPECIES: cobalt-precorrin-6A reductase [unclassified Yoonia]|uniref:cobalt-precorrin-6A reductase n=1 Tax=unclassified Yoonia TaxID=2629118 RepID=UPI002AFE6974|nr:MULTISPECIES: cobalt-precorrin-6A reductase [unclassified Yoonia]